MTKKRGVIIVIILLAAGAAFWWLQIRGEEEAEILPHQIGNVERGDLSMTISTSGQLEPGQERYHRPEQGGEIAEIFVEPGDEVEEGETLYRLDDREQHLEYVQARNALQQARINGTERQIEEQELRLELAERRLEDRKIESRLDGVVGNFDLEAGDFVTGETGTIVVRDETNYLVKVQLDEIDVPLVEEGMEARIEVDALPENNYRGEVSMIEQGTVRDNGVVVVPAEITVEANDERFRSGYSADVDIIVKAQEDILTVPTTAVYTADDQDYVVKVDEEDNPQPTSVTTGMSDDLEVEITSGLEENDRILINVHRFTEFGEPDWQFGPDAGPPPGTPGAQNGGGSQ